MLHLANKEAGASLACLLLDRFVMAVLRSTVVWKIPAQWLNMDGKPLCSIISEYREVGIWRKDYVASNSPGCAHSSRCPCEGEFPMLETEQKAKKQDHPSHNRRNSNDRDVRSPWESPHPLRVAVASSLLVKKLIRMSPFHFIIHATQIKWLSCFNRD